MFCCCQLLINSENEPREACKCSRIIRSWLEWMWRRARPLKINSRINAIAAKNSVGFSSVKKWKGFTNQRFRRDICPAYLANPVQPSNSARRSEEHTSELQSRENLVCRLLLEKKKKKD